MFGGNESAIRQIEWVGTDRTGWGRMAQHRDGSSSSLAACLVAAAVVDRVTFSFVLVKVLCTRVGAPDLLITLFRGDRV